MWECFSRGNVTLSWFRTGPKHVFGHRREAREDTCGKTHLRPFLDPLLIPKRGISRGFGAKWSFKMDTNAHGHGTPPPPPSQVHTLCEASMHARNDNKAYQQWRPATWHHHGPKMYPLMVVFVFRGPRPRVYSVGKAAPHHGLMWVQFVRAYDARSGVKSNSLPAIRLRRTSAS